jgi:hypothetical protein
MPWTIDLMPQREPGLINEYLLVLGKALCLANNFEAKCRHYVRVIWATDPKRSGMTLDELREAAPNFKSPSIDANLKKILDAGDITQETFDILSTARRSRNYIAHESGDLGDLHRASAKRLREAIEVLKPHVENVARGDNITSAWAYEVSEREPAPSSMRLAYVGIVMDWVFKRTEFDSEANEAPIT